MSDIEIIEPTPTNTKKRKPNSTRNNDSSNKRKKITYGLIEKSDTMKGTETEFEEFVIDRTITPQRKLNVSEIEKSEESGITSQWRKRLESTLLGAPLTPESAKKERNNRYKKLCFNCDGEHNVSDCPHPRDHQRIMRKKRESGDEVRRRIQMQNGLTKQKDNKFRPGEMSENLRDALGLRKNDIPEHVYRMRRLGLIKGYPPGWLRKAIKSTGVLKFYTSEEESKDHPDNVEKAPELDTSKLIWYAGFNEVSPKLKDLESFKIPPRDVFCDVYQKELKDRFARRRKNDKKYAKRAMKHSHKKFKTEDSDEDDVVIIENATTSDKYSTPGEESDVVLLNSSTASDVIEDVLEKTLAPEVEMGESMFHTIGTPVLNRHKLTDVVSLEAFSVGIQPFESREEETVNKGNFRKLMETLKKVREQNSPPEESKTSEETKEVEDFTLSSISKSSTSKKSKKKRKRDKQ